MAHSNTTVFTNPSSFILLGIPGLERAQVWISIPFCAMYAVGLLGNFTILFIVKIEVSLHEPMYYFLCVLAVIDLVLSTSVLPKMLGIFYFNLKEIDFNSCFTQMFFIHGMFTMESGVFMTMAVDRYVAICHPLRYSTIMTNPVLAKSAVAVILFGIILVLPMVLLASQWPYCRTNIVPHTKCAHATMVSLACSHYGLFLIIFMHGVDVFFIAVSYGQILRAIFRLPTKETRLKTFGTCGSHLCAIVLFYVPALLSSLIFRYVQNVPQYFNVIMSDLFLLLPPVLNPIIYGVKTKQIQDRLLGLVTRKSS
ncbi:olfactory receptor 52E4-like [Pelodiscus sinensis]|uniref:olfactory receptor 52E4-like n=1 Tax=Pelodiscus sinensis TaxID=13735 RepID=UPI003F6BBC1D